MKRAKRWADFALILRLDHVSVSGTRSLLSSQCACGVLQVFEAMNWGYQLNILPEISWRLHYIVDFPAKDDNVLFLRQYLAFWGAVSITRDGRWMEVDERSLCFPKSSFMTWSFLFLPILITEPWISAKDCYFSFFTWCQSFTLVTSRSYESVSDLLLWLLHCCHLQLLVNL